MSNTESIPPKFRRRADARPDEMLDAALSLFIEQGFVRTSVDQVAKRAGISKGAVYLYFPSKEAILEGLVNRTIAPLDDMVANDRMLFQIDDTHQTVVLRSAQAEVAVARANLENLATGSRADEIDVIAASLDQAEADQSLAQSTLERSQ